jgi:hypothetical protein
MCCPFGSGFYLKPGLRFQLLWKLWIFNNDKAHVSLQWLIAPTTKFDNAWTLSLPSTFGPTLTYRVRNALTQITLCLMVDSSTAAYRAIS